MEDFQIKDYFPTIKDYEQLLKSDLYREIESFSNFFIDKNMQYLESYERKWTSDPFHQWSRQWEYPYVYSSIKSFSCSNKVGEGFKILDAGSGITFLPYFISVKFPAAIIQCCDLDQNLVRIFNQCNNNLDQYIKFSLMDLTELLFESNQFDMIYCISVLEHLSNYEKVVDEFYRVIKPGGRLIITFDISLDSDNPLNPEKTQELLDYLLKRFSNNALPTINMGGLPLKKDFITTFSVSESNQGSLPWHPPSTFKRLKRFL